MKKLIPLLALVLILPLMANASARKLPTEEQAFKEKNLSLVRGPSDDEKKNKDWDHFVKIAIDYEDAEVLSKIFESGKYMDGAPAEIYPDFLIKIYEARPEFFLKTADVFYQGKLSRVSDYFMTPMGEYTVEQAEASLAKLPRTPKNKALIRRFKSEISKSHDRAGKEYDDKHMDQY